MEYNSVAQTEHDGLVDEYPVPASPSRRNHDSLAKTPTPDADLTTNTLSPDENEDEEENNPSSRLSSILPSLASSHSYEMVQENDYAEERVTPLRIRKRETHNEVANQSGSPTPMQSHLEDAPVRTASISRHLPLNHPKPDLQSMQGAYVKNVERLEESAERLSMTSSLEEELQKMNVDQQRLHRQSSAPTRSSPHNNTSRQVSSGSLSNSITGVNAAARWGGYSPSGYVTSFQEAARSNSRSQSSHQSRPISKPSYFDTQRLHLEFEGRPLGSSPLEVPLPLSQGLEWPKEFSPAEDTYHQVHRIPSNASADRPATSASNETYRQATSLFRDFDGVHYTTHMLASIASMNRQTSLTRQISLEHPPLATDSKAFREAQPGQHMVYYPAPVPMMLNLPQKLSKFSTADRDKRRSQALAALTAEQRKSAAWLQADQHGQENIRRSRQALSGLPAQLRASAFFDQPSVTQNLKIQGGSAVATLDSILDASAHAPVSAFTDHPIVGQLGREVYGRDSDRQSVHLQDAKPEKKAKHMSSLSNMLGAGRRASGAMTIDNSGRQVSRESKASELEANGVNDNSSHLRSDDLERTAEESIAPTDDELMDGENGLHQQFEDEDYSEAALFGAPTTLLAELQMRKAQQKQRNRTAADAFPDGMHSTLLELDAVTQLQQKSRKQKHITLAWEDHETADQENFDDDDVPLGVLFPGQKEQVNSNRPVGLLEKRHIEDNEPLSQRRARLRGDAPSLQARSTATASVKQDRPGSMYTLDVGLPNDTVAEQEEESLAQRLKRLRAEKEQGQAGKFAYEVSSQLGLKVGNENVSPTVKTPDAEETLGQRRKRLQADAANGRQVSGGSPQSANAPPLQSWHSMAGLLSAHPVNGTRIPSNEAADLNGRAVIGNQQQAQFSTNVQAVNGMSNGSFLPPPAILGLGAYHLTMPITNGSFNPPVYSPNMAVQMQMNGYSGYPFAMQQQMPGMTIGMGPPLDPKQRDGIERWRQSVA